LRDLNNKIKFQIEELDYQEDAVNSVIDLLKGIDRHSVSSIYSTARVQGSMLNGRPEANVRFSSTSRLLQNLQKIQYRNELFKDDHIVGAIPQFSIEMETGTGKTFVYLETILRLWSEFGGQFKKFIIVVPSNPILLGVKKSIATFADYFKTKFNNIDLNNHYFVFDKNVTPETVTSKLIESNDLSIMLITNHSFNKDSNRLRNGKENGVAVWDDIKDIAPIIVIDEPQKMDGSGRKKSASLLAIEELNPPMILRYSATHKNLYNQIYKLDSYKAYKKNLVKNIKVTTIHSLTPKDFPYIRYIKFLDNSLQARIEIFHKEQGKDIKCAKFDVDNNASLEELSGGLPQYRNWYIAVQPRKNDDLQISTDSGEIFCVAEGKSNDEVDHDVAVEKQMEIAIKAHIKKQAEILNSGKKIKVLTLFFVDSVAKVRSDEGDGRGTYLKIFDRVFEKIRSQANLFDKSTLSKYPKEFAILNPDTPVESVREGYFAVDKTHKAVDVDGWNSDKDDEDVKLKAKAQEDVDRGIDLILNKKDELISFDEPLSFIFSHSALREGWDNPNVFVLVTIKETGSDIAKKQEVGRGLRLPVDISGTRCYDSSINELTIVANDYYDHFADSLQDDYNKSSGFNKEEVTADIIKITMVEAGIPEDNVEDACDAFIRELVASNFVKIEKTGKITLKNSEVDFKDFVFNDPVLIEHSNKIKEAFIKAMKDKGSKKIDIANGDEPSYENAVQKYVNEAEFQRIYQKLLTILQKRSVYRYKLDKDKFIKCTTTEIDRQLAKHNDFIQFEVTNAEVDFNDSKKMTMVNAQKQVENSDSHTLTYEAKPLFDLVNVIMANTMLPRLAIIKIINGLTKNSRNKINNQDYLEEAIKIINQKLKEFKSKEFLKAEIIEGIGANKNDIFEVDKIINEEEIRYLFTPNPSHRKAMNLKYKFDSEGELKFAKVLDNDSNVLLYTKLKKGGFVLETPAGNYSPDWAIVYQKSEEHFAMYFIAETKWDKDAGGLNDDERIKIRCAKKHFEAVNESVDEIVKYDWVNAYNDITKSQSFPQVFTDENYADELPIERL
jgi:type III restriction enzyme